MIMDGPTNDRSLEVDIQTELFLQLAEIVSTTTRTGPALALACERLATILDCTRVSIFLLKNGQVIPRMSRFANGVIAPGQWDEFRTSSAANNPPAVVSDVLVRGVPVVCSTYENDWWSQHFDIASMMAVPIGNSSHPLGVLVADSQVPYEFRPEQIRLATALGVQLGGIVALARQIEEQHTRLGFAEASRELYQKGSLSTTTLGVAETLARVTAKVLGGPIAWSITVNTTGSITQVTSFGVPRDTQEKVRVALEGKPFVSTALGGIVGPEWTPLPIDEEISNDDFGLFGVRSGWCIPISCLQENLVALVIVGGPSAGDFAEARHRDLVNFLAQETSLIAENAILREHDHYQATHDSLTSLANRAAFEDYLAHALAIATRTSGHLAVLLLDLNRFKDVNDTLGHHIGDALLNEVAQRLTSVMREADVVARLGGDEFVILLSTSADISGAKVAAKRLVTALEQPLLVAHRSIWIGASIGIACFPEHGTDPQTLLHRADLAMYEAKRTTVGVVAYDASVDRAQSSVPGLLLELPRAIQQNELVVHYQPKLDLNSHEVLGVEALVRWAHPTLGLLGPEQFVPLAEATGIIRQLTSWVLATALGQAAVWRASGRALRMSVNISARDLVDMTLPNRVTAALVSSGVPADQLTLELTESAIMSDEARGTEVLTRLRQLGVRISLDDFGTGYSSLAYLERLPLDEVKIDRSFLGGGNGAESFLVRSMAKMGHHLGLQIVVEGIEHWTSYESVARIDCDELQGFALSPPLEAAQLEQWLDDWTSNLPSGSSHPWRQAE
ncbi:sensor domain-containing phosphodiesterase [Ferrimicrobium acidiphilum]|uniref:sensor domain-containing phosphodiesterase n=2 Tax=Ferrimicrobium acidiphilum TaxID=121039 RepID=UPI0023F1C5AD|nr:EAL domain-containing protein [Ferrimicrobium acidiphilum]